MYLHGAVLADDAGGFRLTGLPADAIVWMQTYKDGYVQQAAAGPIVVRGDMTIDLQLTSKDHLTTSSCPSSAPVSRNVSGAIVEVTAAGTQPVPSAFVDFEPLEDFVAAVTYSDASGRFVLCGLPQNIAVSLGASSGSRVAYATVPPGQTFIQIILR